ncbi:chorismate-binding protein [Flavobacterium magnum]|nr:chorismate-binding protein [Flavobacterium magnum]
MRAGIPMMSLLDKAGGNLSAGLPFVLYKKPDHAAVRGLFQKSSQLHTADDFDGKGYVFAPFYHGETLIIPDHDADFLYSIYENDGHLNSTSVTTANETGRDFHLKLVTKGIRAILDHDFEKVVLSRKERFDLVAFDFRKIYAALLQNYPEAYVYCWFHPETGFWFGAFSEQLLRISDGKLHTMAVAGTQKWHEGLTWQEKEKHEQQFVSDFISDALKDFSISVQSGNPYTLRAGALAHIRTDISADLKPDADLNGIIGALHPTPAVCGLPKRPALEFILENEGYDRDFYAGFHGELNRDFLHGTGQTDFFVNLRCMQVDTDGISAGICVGGGITKDSDPEAEWLETVHKSQTIKKVLF